MKTIEHAIMSLDLFGLSAMNVHKWLDTYPKTTYHNKLGVEIGVGKFGSWAKKHIIQHVEDDVKEAKRKGTY